MKNKGMFTQFFLVGQKEKRPQEGGVRPKILSTAGLMGITIVITTVLVKEIWRTKA